MQIAQACADYFGLPHINLSKNPIDTSLATLITHPLFFQYAFLPLNKNENELTIAISDPYYLFLANELKFQLNLNINMVFASYDQLMSHLNDIISKSIYLQTNDETSIITLTNQLLTDAIYRGASDVHGEILQQFYRIRMRIDGILHEIVQLPINLAAAITSRFKIMAELDIAEKRMPQDGRFTFTTITGITRDCRISSCPTIFGEKIVIRLLNPTKHLLQIDELGLEHSQQQILLKAITEPQGLILITGPTGSGKTITLYTILNRINTQEKNISTIEDPVEIHLSGINQVNINLKAGLNFTTALRAFLRQDPDIIMVGEIRDFETASMAIRAAHTGHLVLSTLHTNSAAEALTRLVNMGIESFNIASTVTLIIAQRLVRIRCTHCDGIGCEFCLQGYKGRTGIFEILPIDQQLRELILANAPASVIAATTEKHGIQNLWQIGLNKVNARITNMTEIYRVLPSQH
jgi:type IV pilus assembly protein PilB